MLRILVVDDEINIAEGICSILTSRMPIPCAIHLATTVEDALAVGRQTGTDLLISDIVMPGMSGLDLIRTFLHNGYCAYAIILSGHDKFSYAQTALRYGVLDYLLKPVDSGELVGRCMRVNTLLAEDAPGMETLKYPDHPFFSKDICRGEYPASLRKIIGYVEQNYMKEITLQGIAEELMLNASYMSSLINRHCGHSFNYLLDYVRLATAVKLLQSESKLSISELSYLVGYASERRLYHAFQKRLGCTPGQMKGQLAEMDVGRMQ